MLSYADPLAPLSGLRSPMFYGVLRGIWSWIGLGAFSSIFSFVSIYVVLVCTLFLFSWGC
jgi:hypothetical protein